MDRHPRSPRYSLPAGLIVALLLSLLTLACGGSGSDAGQASTSNMPPRDLTSAVLSLADLGASWRQVDDQRDDSESFSYYGKMFLLTDSPYYSQANASPIVVGTSAARLRKNDVRDPFKAFVDEVVFGESRQGLDPAAGPSVGQESRWWFSSQARAPGAAAPTQGSTSEPVAAPTATHVLAFRANDMYGMVILAGPPGAVSQDQAISYAKIMASRM